jgi:two-component system invasion response regulator UvrY
MTRILLADDHTLVRAGLRRLLESDKDIEVVAEVGDSAEAIKKAKQLKPDLVVLDISMPGPDALQTTKQVKEVCPECDVLIVTIHDEEQYGPRLLRAGAKGYVTKNEAPEVLLEAIHTVRKGDRYLSRKLEHMLALRLVNSSEDLSPVAKLSDRELQVLTGLAEGKKNREIAKELGLSVNTIDVHRARILSKLKLRNNADLTRFAIANKLVRA